LSTTRYCLLALLANCFALICGTDIEVSPNSARMAIPWYHKNQKKTDQLWFQPVKFCTWQILGMHMHRLAQVWNAIITTNYYDVI